MLCIMYFQRIDFSIHFVSRRNSFRMTPSQWKAFLSKAGALFILQGYVKSIGVIIDETVFHLHTKVAVVSVSFALVFGFNCFGDYSFFIFSSMRWCQIKFTKDVLNPVSVTKGMRLKVSRDIVSVIWNKMNTTELN